jgi:serine/threonine-protein kinase
VLSSTVVGATPREQGGSVNCPSKLLQQIGRGGFGVVYMAEQKKPVRRTIALKVIEQGMDTSDFIARFEAERQALALMERLTPGE